VLSAGLNLEHGSPEVILNRTETFAAYRRRTQPPGASMGSMFKNPAADYAGRLIEAAGLKGTRIGDAQISTLHANFFINLGQATAADIKSLIVLAQQKVFEQFGVSLTLEIELLGEW
jgi:UDP-N-acetylmuramate dehydrogenase